MKPQEWRQKLGDCVRDLFLSPEMQHFYSHRDDDGTGADLSFAVGDLRPPAQKFLAAGGGELPGVRGQATHHGARARRIGRR